MFDLGKAITEFTDRYFEDGKPIDPSSAKMVEDLAEIQKEAVQSGVKPVPLDELTNRTLGPAPPIRSSHAKNYLSDRDKDALNKALRELEATQNLATHYKTLAETLQTEKDEADRRIAAFEDVSATLYTQLEDTTAALDASTPASDSRMITEKALRTVRRVQKEAREVIKSLETRLENAIRVGDQFAENAIVLRRIVDTLYRQFVNEAHNNQNNYVSTKGTAQKVSERIGKGPQPPSAVKKIEESQDRKHGPTPSPSYSGARAGWW